MLGVRSVETARLLELLKDPAKNQPRLLKEIAQACDHYDGLYLLLEQPGFAAATVGFLFPCMKGKYCATLKHFLVIDPDRNARFCPRMEEMNPATRYMECYANRESGAYIAKGFAGAVHEDTLAGVLADLRVFAEGNAITELRMAIAIEQFDLPFPDDAIYGRPSVAFAALRGSGYSVDLNEPVFWGKSGDVDAVQAKILRAAQTLEKAGLTYVDASQKCKGLLGPRVVKRSEVGKKDCVTRSLPPLNAEDTFFKTLEAAGYKYDGKNWNP